MYLQKVGICGFRSCNDIEILFEDLTILIGENDSGKSSVLDALGYFFSSSSPEPNDYYKKPDGKTSNKIEIVTTFLLDKNDDIYTKYSIENHLIYKKEFHISGKSVNKVFVEVPENENFNFDFANTSAEEQKTFLKSQKTDLEDKDISNSTKRAELFTCLYDQQKKVKKWLEIKNNLGQDLCIFDRYSAMDYTDPAGIATKTFRQIFEQTIYKENPKSKEPELIPELKKIEKKAMKEINSKVLELSIYLKKYCSHIINFDYQPTFDFKNGIRTGEFYIDRGNGLFPLSRVGDGSKRRMFLAVTDWDREVLSSRQKSSSELKKLVIRAYDEPDTNLHYEAQRLMFYSISQIADTKKNGVQAILCTHSLTMIDRAPAQNIRLFSIDNSGFTRVKQLHTGQDPQIEIFLKEIAAELGITNSIMFYERCFVIVEGETEYNSLPILYKKVYNRSIIEDGIRIINVQSNSGVYPFLKLFILNKPELLIIFIDKDSENKKELKLTPSQLRQIGFTDEYISSQLLFIGNQEFEDCFSDQLIASALNNDWPKKDGNPWLPEDINSIRASAKFSDALKSLVWNQAKEDSNRWSKPDFGKALAEICTPENIPQDILSLFSKAQEIITK